MGETAKLKLREALGDGQRADGFEDFIQFASTVGGEYPDASPDVLRVVRFIELISVACVEGATEATNAGGGTAEVIDAMCFGAAIALTSAVMSPFGEDVPADVIRDIVRTSFIEGLEQAISSQRLK